MERLPAKSDIIYHINIISHHVLHITHHISYIIWYVSHIVYHMKYYIDEMERLPAKGLWFSFLITYIVWGRRQYITHMYHIWCIMYNIYCAIHNTSYMIHMCYILSPSSYNIACRLQYIMRICRSASL